MNGLQEITMTEPRVPPQILLMEDELSVAKGLQMVLSEEGYGVDVAMTGTRALEIFGSKEFDLLVADLRLPDIDGMEVIKAVKEKRPETEVVVITGYASVASAVEAMKTGAFDYLPKPFTEEEFRASVEGALKEKKEVRVKEPVLTAETEEERLIQKREVTRVLNRTSEDPRFWRELMEEGSVALEEYRLSNEAKAAIVSGDLKWINEHVGELTQKQLMFIYKRLEREAW
ncbi:MAG: response regulator [Deltaproteobacteria bacterium]|nr:response regulator [Deltaproteobacteria bacterium]